MFHSELTKKSQELQGIGFAIQKKTPIFTSYQTNKLIKKLQILLVMPFIFMACSDSNDQELETLKVNNKLPPSIIISDVSGVACCDGCNKQFGAEFTVNQTTFDSYYDGSGSNNGCWILIREELSQDTVAEEYDGICINSSRIDRTTSCVDFNCNESGSPIKISLDPSTDYEIQLYKLNNSSGWHSFTTPATSSINCCLG